MEHLEILLSIKFKPQQRKEKKKRRKSKNADDEKLYIVKDYDNIAVSTGENERAKTYLKTSRPYYVSW